MIVNPFSELPIFLNPFQTPLMNEQPPFKFNTFSSSSSSSSVFEPNEYPLKLHFSGWRFNPFEKWECWVDELKPKYESVWKKAGIFDAIMSTKCNILKDQNLLYGVVEKWCCKTYTFVFPFGEATITLEDAMVLGGYPVIGHPVFISLEDEEMREVEKKMILAKQQLSKSKQGMARTSIWMDFFINKGSEIEHEAFLATWLSIFVFPHNNLVKIYLFPIAIHLARGNPIALAPAVLASLYKDLSLLKKTIVGLKNYRVGGDRFPLEVTFQSPFYLVQIWVWERFKHLQPISINHGDPLLFRWHKVKPLRISDVRLELDSAMDDFLWRPYVRYVGKCGMFYPNNEILVPFKKDLVDQQMLSFAICLRVSELVGIDSIEQYLPHRVAMQFGMDQDVPSYVRRFNETKAIAWKNYCRRISDKNLYFPSRFFEANASMHYAKWWEQSVLDRGNFVKKIVQQKRSASSRKNTPHVGKANISGNDVGVTPGFPTNCVETLIFGNFCDVGSKTKTRKVDNLDVDVPNENSVHDCLIADENIDVDAPSASSLPPKHNTQVPFISVKDHGPVLKECSFSASSTDYEKILPLKRPLSKDSIELSIGGLKKGFKDANGSKEARISSDRVCLFDNQGEIHSNRNKVPVEERGERDHEVVVLSKEQYLVIQEELARLARQQEEILQLMVLREKKDEELRNQEDILRLMARQQKEVLRLMARQQEELLTTVLRNQHPPPSPPPPQSSS